MIMPRACVSTEAPMANIPGKPLTDVIEDAAFGEVTKTIADKTSIEVYLGRR